MGLRVALGAKRTNVLQLILGQSMRLAMVGMAIGMSLAAAITRFAATFLYGISPTDPITFASIAAVLGFFALTACYFPARRATRVDPMVALRYE